MKTIYKKIKIITILFLISITVFSQQAFYFGPDAMVNVNDSVVIRLNDYLGDIQWQKTYELDGTDNWININDANADTLLFIADETTYFRAKVIAGECEPFYSDTTQVQVYEIKNEVVLIDEEKLHLISDSTQIEDGTYVFSGTNIYDIKVGDVILGQQGEGFMRKILSIQELGNDLILETDQATLEDVFEDFYLEDSVLISLNGGKSINHKGRPIPVEVIYLIEGAKFNEKGSGINLSNIVIFSGEITDDNNNTATIEVGIEEGNVNFEPILERQFNYKKVFGVPTRLNSMYLKAGGKIEANMSMYVQANAKINYSRKITLAIIEVPIPAGPVPVTVRLSFYLGFNTNMDIELYATAGFASEYEVAFGANYDRNANPQWEQIWERDADFTPAEPTFSAYGLLTAKGYIEPKLAISLAGVIGPSFSVDPYLRFLGEVQPPNWYWELAAGVGGKLGFQIGLFGYNLLDYNIDLFTWDNILASGTSELEDLGFPVADFIADQTSITEGETINFTCESTNDPTSWEWNFGDGNTSTQQNPSHTYNTAGTYTVSLTATNTFGSDTETKTDYITVSAAPFTCGNNVSFNYKGIQVTYGTVPGVNNRCWLDRNLGASQVATSSTDAASYGDLFQWGRGDDGHQNRNSETTIHNISNSDNPGHGNFITFGSSPYDWRSPQNHNLWQGVSGTNNPCPSGWRIPTESEWNAEHESWDSNNAAGAFASPLKLPVAGFRSYIDGSLSDVGSHGVYWSSTVDDFNSWALRFLNSDAYMVSGYRAGGGSVRCLME